MKGINRKYLLGSFLLMVCLIMWCLNYLTPLSSDDWTDFYVVRDQIHSFGDIIKSQYVLYTTLNGRIIPHFIIQLCDILLGKGLFNIVNAIMLLVFLYAIAINVTDDRKQYYKIFSAAFILLFFLMPGFDLGFLWLCGACNYLWIATMLLFFHFALEKKRFESKISLVLLFLYGIVCGWTNEALVLGLAGAYFIYYATHRKELTRQKAIMLAGFFIGTVLLVSSPGSIQRAFSVGYSRDRSLHSIAHYLVDMDNLRIFFLTIAAVIIMAWRGHLQFKRWFKTELVFILAVVITFAFVIYTTYDSDHSRIGIETFSLVLLLRSLPWERINERIFTVANAITLVVAAFAIHASYQCHLVNQQEFEQIERHEYPIQTTMADYHPFFDRYIVAYSYASIGERYKYYGKDGGMSKFYGNDSIYFLPRDFVQETIKHPEKFATFQSRETWPFFVIKAKGNENEKTYAQIEFEPTDFSKLKWPLRLIAHKLPEYYGNQLPVEVEQITLNGSDYILVDKNLTPGREVKSITLKDNR